VDIGHGFVVRQELQNAADASALAGAGNLTPLTSTSPTSFDWTRAEGIAGSSITWNKADGQVLSTVDQVPLRSGFYNLLNRTLQSKNITPGAQDVPFVQVTVSKNSTQNAPEVSTWFARIFGKDSFPVGPVSAIAVISGPGFAPPGTGMMPMAINSAMADNFKNYMDAQHKFKIMSTYGAPLAQAGQFSSLLVDFNNVAQLRTLITTLNTTGTPTQINIGSTIYMQPGVDATLYYSNTQESLDRFVGKDVFLPVVSGSLTSKVGLPVVGFVGFHVFATEKAGNNGNVEGWFTTGLILPNSGGSGPYYGVWTVPHLVL